MEALYIQYSVHAVLGIVFNGPNCPVDLVLLKSNVWLIKSILMLQ